jgi:hypothetical protein
MWQKFYKFWLAVEIPVLVVRYEDLLAHKLQVHIVYRNSMLRVVCLHDDAM